MKIINKLKNEIKIVKWPTKKTVKKDFVITLVASTGIMLVLSVINMIANLLLSFII